MKHIEENGVSKKTVADLTRLIQSHLDALMGNFCRYFASEKINELKDMWWVKNPFDFETPDSTAGLNLNPSEESEMLQPTCDARHVENSSQNRKNCLHSGLTSPPSI